MNTFNQDNVIRMSIPQLVRLYHSSQLAFVRTCTQHDWSAALTHIRIVVQTRIEVASRQAILSPDHMDFLREMLEETKSLTEYINNDTTTTPYRIRSWNLVGNAVEAGAHVPQEVRPVGWFIKGYRSKRRCSILINRLRKLKTASRRTMQTVAFK